MRGKRAMWRFLNILAIVAVVASASYV